MRSGLPAFTPVEWVERHRRLYLRCLQTLEEHLDPAVYTRTVEWWTDALRQPVLEQFDPVLIHGDLASEHILLDVPACEISGVIDFGDAMVADPALDLAGLPEALAWAVARHLGLDSDGEFWVRHRLYISAVPFHSISAGVELGHADLIWSGIDGIQARCGNQGTALHFTGYCLAGSIYGTSIWLRKSRRVAENVASASCVTFEQLIERYQGEIFGYILRMVRQDGEAQDLCQETFLRAYRAFGRLDGQANHRAWLYKIATNTTFNHLRGRKSAARMVEALAVEKPTTTQDGYVDGFDARQLLSRIEHAIEELPPKQRVALTQRQFFGLSYAEIAEGLDCSEESARAHVYQAVRKLRSRFSEELGEVGI